MDDLIERLGTLSEDELKKLGQKLSGRATPAGARSRIVPRDESQQRLPLSFAQERLWFVEQLGMASGAHDLSAIVTLQGELDVVALERSLQAMVARHEVLRTSFANVDGQGVQVVGRADGFELRKLQLREHGEQAQAALQALVREEAGLRFDLAQGPLLRAALVHVAAGEHVLMLTMHHIAADGGSIAVLVRETSALYEAFSQGRESPLAPLPVQYADYALWQRQWLQGAVLERQLAYWTQALAGAPAALELPTDRPRPAVASFKGAAHHFTLPRALADAASALARREGATLFMVLMATYQTLLWRWSGQADVLVGTPIAGRQHRELEGLLGFFVNTLVMRAQLRTDDRFVDLLGRTRQAALGAYAHQELPFEKLVEALQPVRDLGRQPVYQVWFVLELQGQPVFRFPGVAATQRALDRDSLLLDLSLSLRETADGLAGTIDYATDLFDESTARRLAQGFEMLLGALVDEPDAVLAELPLIDSQQRQQLLRQGEGALVALPSTTLAERLQEQAQRNPHAVALRMDGQSLTYAQLDARSNQVARHLLALGVGPDVLVGLCVPRSLAMIVGLLGILKAGAAWLPLDAEWPAQRLSAVLGEAMAPVLLTHGSVLARLPAHWGHLVQLDEDWAEIEQQDAGPLQVPVHPHQLAYAIYTSGSTGRPKGVAVTQQALANQLQWMLNAHPLGEGDVVLQKTAPGFDASVWEVLAPLLAGAMLALAPLDAPQDPQALCRACAESGVTTLQLVPTMLQLVLQQPELGRCTALRDVFSGGEALTGELVEQFHRTLPGRRLHNLYGPTETCIQVLAQTVEADDGTASAPLGTPVWNTRVHVLDERLNPVPVGVVGELYVSGPQLARGYLQRAAQTAERFVADPHGGVGGRLYRTGDLVRWRDGGRLEFVGRADQQVKLRGLRIELGEIEAALHEQPGVAQAAVQVREDVPGEQRLVAYVVGQELAADTLRTALKQRLPDYMVPTQIVELAALPLNASGKLDRRALPAPEGVIPRVEHVAPRNEIEHALVALFAQILGVDEVGVHDSFFDLGGHSLLATRLVSQVRATLQVELALRAIFEAPTVAQLGERVAALRQAAQPVLAPIQAGVRPANVPLSYSQERLWFLEQLHEIDEVYHIFGAVRLQGELDGVALEHSLQHLMARHEVLRTSFANVDGQGVQVVGPADAFELRKLQAREPGEVQALMRTEARTRFDLAQGPLLRAALVHVAAGEHVLMLTMHHIAADGWSIGVLVREMSALYEAFSQGRESPLAPLPVQYADYALWQRQWLQGAVLERQLAYWTQALAGAPTALELPTDRPRPAVASFKGAAHHFTLPRALADAASELARREGATLFMVLMAAYQTLLWRWSGQADVLVGTPIAGRQHRELEGLLGFFVNTLVMRAQLRADDRFVDLLGRTRQAALGAYAHQELPFEKLVEALQPVRDLGRQPVFQAWFVLGRFDAAGSLALHELALEMLPVEQTIAKFDLTLALEETPDGLAGTIEYATDLFDESTARRLAHGFEMLLGALVDEPDAVLAELPLIDAQQRQQLLRQGEGAVVALPSTTLAERLQARAQRSAHAVALRMDGQSLTYAQLDARSNQVARHLLALGVGPDVLVGLCVPRSLAMIVGLLGILKAGAAWLPLDAEWPAQRLSAVLGEAMSPVLLTHGSVLARLPAHWGHLVQLDEDWAEIEQQDAGPLHVAVHPHQLAYAIYTSGSTGLPKGVAVTQQALANQLQWMLNAHPLGEGDVVLQKTAPGFDASVWEVLAPLLAGATLALAPLDAPQDPQALCRACAESGVTTLQLVPTMLQLVLQQPELGRCTALRDVFSGGEALTGELVEQFHRALPGRRLHNLYGPTETCIQVLAQTVEIGDVVPLGTPVWNTRVHVLDERLNPVPVGVVGELYVGGAQLARGYLQRAAQTAERFVADPHGGAGGRLYRTGDLVRWRDGGRLEFVGRADQQVKLRGLRIELGEIEAALQEQPGVAQAAAQVREDVPGEQRLVAYVVGQELGADALRAALRQRLPDYMVPTQIVQLAALPLNASGKLDRRALPAPDALVVKVEHVAPRNEIERQLVALFAQILGLDEVGVHDSFFDLGGHSLLATRLVSQVRATLQVELALRAIFEAPTVAQLGERVGALRQAAQPVLAPIEAGVRPANIPLSYSQERLWFLEQLHEIDEVYHIFGAVRLQGGLDGVALERSLQALVARHEVLRTSFANVDGQGVQVVGLANRFELRKLQLREHGGQAQARLQVLMREESGTRFDLAQGPLLRAALVHVAAGEHVLMLTMHHIAADGWSIGVLVREMSALYEAFSQGRESPLAPLPVQYADYALWQRQWLQGAVLERQLAYWTQALAGAPTALELPTDRPRPAVASFKGAAHHFTLPRALADAASELARREGATLFMVLMAAYQTLLWRWSGQADVLVGTPIAGRQHRELEGLLGFFVNTLVMRAQLQADDRFVDLLGRTRQAALGAYAHQELPFEKLVEALQPVRDLSRQPLAPVQMVFVNMPQVEMELAGVQWHVLEVPKTTSPFDLNLTLQVTEDGLVGHLEYATDLFDESTVKRLARGFELLLRAVTQAPSRALGDLPLLDPADEQRLLRDWSSTADAPAMPQESVQRLIERQADRTPDAVAVLCDEQSLTYAQLDAQSNQVARHLRALGVGPDVLVGLCVPRSLRMIVGLLGILKAGAAYLPLDAEWPAQRLSAVLGEAMSPVLLTHGSVLARLPTHWGHLVQLDEDWAEIQQQDAGPLHVPVHPHQLAYAIYTSGSTGQPKGVAVTHGGLAASTAARLRCYGDISSMLLLPPLTFDSSVATVFGTLCAGGSVCIPAQGLERDLTHLAKLVERYALRGWLGVPSMYQAVLDTAGRRLAPLATVICAGEALSPSLVDKHLAHCPRAALYNEYGPTEATIWTTVARVEKTAPGGASGDIGRPVGDSSVYVLDDRLNPVPVGVVGELYVGGAQLARGYLQRAAQTAERFVADPHGGAGGRLYRTGDLVRWRDGGHLEFVGRADQQVKLRGLRIELGEIEAALQEQPGVAQAAAQVREDVPGEPRLVGYVAGQGLVADVLRTALKQRLPDYMVPAQIVHLAALPLNANGKLDRRALPAPEGVNARVEHVGPSNEREHTLANIWSDVLGIEPPGIDDDFFDLGGHSLAAMQVIARIQDEFGVEAALRDLFEFTTIRTLVQRLQATSSHSPAGDGSALPIEEGSV